MKSILGNFWSLIKQTAVEWYNDNAPRLAAAIAYYTVFSLAPLLVVAIAIAGLAFGREAVQGELSHQLQGLIGRDGAKAVEGLVASAWKPSSGIWATVVGGITLILGGTAVLSELRSVLNQIWEVPPKKLNGVWALVRDRLLSLAMIGAIGFLLLVSLVMSAVLAAVSKYFSGYLPFSETLTQLLYFGVSLVLITLLFAAIFKVLPDIRVDWREVWVGALITSFLFNVGKFLIGLYLGQTSFAGAYGASGSFAIILIWAYYSSLIFIFGAEFTQVYANSRRAGALATTGTSK